VSDDKSRMLELRALFRTAGASPLCSLRLAIATVEFESKRRYQAKGKCECQRRDKNGVRTTCEEKAMKVWKP